MATRRTRASVSLILIAALAGPAIAQQSRRSSAAAATPAAANVPGADWMTTAPQTFSVVLQVERPVSQNGDRGAGVTAQVAAAICKSSAVADPALAAAFGMPADQARPLAVIDAQPTSDTFLTLTVTLNDPQKKLPADAGAKLLDELATRSAKAVAKSAELQVAPLRERRADYEKRIADAQAQADALDAQYAKLGPLADVNGNFNRNNGIGANLQQQRNQLATQLAGLKARLAAVERNAPQPAATQPAPPPPPAEPTSRPADVGVDLLTRRETAVAKARASGDEAAIAEAESRLAEARVLTTLLDTIRASAPLARPIPTYTSPFGSSYPGGPGTFDAGALRVQIADLEAQVASIDAQLAAMPAPSTQPTMTPNDINQLSNDRNEARQRVRGLRSELEQFDRQNGSIRATRIVPLTGTE